MIPPTPAASQYLRELILKGSAIVLDDQKDYLLQARLGPLIEREGMTTWEELVKRLAAPGTQVLRQRVIEAMTTHETSFFRDWHPFEAMQAQILPELAAESHKRLIHIWSAAASSGQEVYSLAFLAAQHPGMDLSNVRFVATDISSEILARAREGRYSQLEVNRGLPARLLLRFFDKHGVDYRVKEEIRRLIEFKLLNLIDRWPALPEMDVIFLRNVLIYFDVPTRRLIIERIVKSMRKGGYLFLGGVESTLNLTDRLVEVHIGKTTCHRLA
ncbi:MAG TPA: protein-glutamate O-methyltransferase CheR [Polyangia bacterium]|jgi:chemotaxis protein methyltransferase CheR|nr:protein-glutamate O-methyltransferase CheR [Polyangia bacterium]